MKAKVFLVSGKDEPFVKIMTDLEKMLTKFNCKCQRYVAGPFVLFALYRAIRNTPKDIPFLFVFKGHGDHHGWEGNLYYRQVSYLLGLVRGPLLVVNDTCYGFSMLEYLKKKRREDNTGFIAPWDSEGLSYGGATEDMLHYWSKGKIVEDEVEKMIYSTMEEDVEFPVQQRWGAILDHLFFLRPLITKER